MLYQDVKTTPGQTIYWRLSHMGRSGVDTMQVRIGPATNDPYDTTPQTQMSTGNTAWETYSGSYTVPAGQTTTRFGFEALNTASGIIGNGNFLDDIFLGTEPCVVAEKSVSPEGEVYAGQVLTYEVTIKNQGGDIAANAIFEDAIPAGTEYVPGSLKIIAGPGASDLTDEEDNDAGQFNGEKVIIDLGDLPNTTNLPDGITVQFKVRAIDTDTERVVSNKALVNYDNLLTNEPESTETNETTTTVVPREEIDACAVPVALINGDFDEPAGPGTYDNSVAGGGYYYADTVPGWKTTDLNRTPRGIIQIMDPARPSTIPSNTPNRENLTSRFAELNADTNSMLYQELPTVPGQTIYWRLDHRGYSGVDTMSVNIGAVTADPFNTTPEIERISTGTTWKTYSGSYTVPAGQTVTRFGFKAISTSTGALAFGNYLDNIFLGTEPCATAEKTVSPGGDVFAGDELTYEVTVKNNGGDIAANTILEDAIPTGTEYIPGSLKIIDGPGTGDLTDAEDNDAGHFDGTKVVVKVGDLPNSNDLPNGVTVQFKVKALLDESISEITNKAQINYDNLLTNESKTTESNETTTGLTYKKPVLESKKSSELSEKLDGNEDTEHPEVGDTLTYTIETRNTIEDSLIKNLTISDTIPAGLEYVPGTLVVDGQAVTDAEGDDKGHVVNGSILAQLGDVADTNWHSVTFEVIVGAGQAGKDIINIATATGDNVEIPDKPEHELIVYPRVPVLQSEKTSSIAEKGEGNTLTDTYQVGDTILYTIRAHNTVKESVVENFVISDVLPEGLTFVEGSLEASHDGTVNYENGTVTANFGNVADNEWRTVTFQVTIDSGQSNTTIKNTATADGDNIVVPDEPENEITVEPRDPKLESKKSSEIDTKAAGNTDALHPEVGDILTYTIQTRNTIEDSLVTNLTIRDVLPEGLEYVAGTLTVDGVAVTDAEGDDAGHSVDGEIFGAFGDITDTAMHTVTFQVVIGAGQASKDIENIATVDGDNIEVPDEPSEEVLVYPRFPDLESEKTSSIAEKGEGNTVTEKYQVGDTIEYTIQSRNMVRESVVKNFVISDVLPEGVTFVDGSLEASHGGTVSYANGTITANFGDVEDTEWRTVTFQATIDSVQVGNTLRNVATVTGDNTDEPDQPENEIIVDPRDPKLQSRKTATLTEKAEGNTDSAHAEVGDILTYTIETRNTKVDSLIENLVISDTIPEGVAYVPGTLIIDGVAVTDAAGDDAGHSVNGEIVANYGDVSDTYWHKVTFQVTVTEGQAGNDIVNIATVTGDNITVPDKPENELNIYPRNPVLESVKTAVNAEEGKENYEVGDTILYTIQARNTVKDSVVEDLVISDALPEGLSFVEGSIEVSHEGTYSYEDGTITASFGDVTDTAWRTVTFEAQINSDQFGKRIENIAAVNGSNIETPDKPKKEITVDKEVTVTPEQPEGPKDQDNNTGKEPDDGKKLPVTATNNYNFLLIGALLLLAGMTILFVRRRKA